jgi:glycosyltransferase involved in cell wall biosynthesis
MSSDDAAGTAVPLVSICLPVYNDADTVGETLSSLLGQSYPNFEIVISDNASTDGTREVVGSFRDHRIRYRRNETNVGAFPNWNLAIRDARGEHIAVYHADDVYHPDILAVESGFLSGHPEAGAVFALDDWIDADGRWIGESRLPPGLSGRSLHGFPEVFESLLLHGNNFLRCPTFMARRDVFDRVGYFEERLEPYRSARDLEFFLRLLREYPIGIIDRIFVRYRISKRQGTADAVYLRTGESDHHRVMDHFITSLGDGVPAYPEDAIRSYRFFRNVDLLFRATNCVLKGEIAEAGGLAAEGRKGLIPLSGFRASRFPHIAYAWLLSGAIALGIAPALAPALKKVLAARSAYYGKG